MAVVLIQQAATSCVAEVIEAAPVPSPTSLVVEKVQDRSDIQEAKVHPKQLHASVDSAPPDFHVHESALAIVFHLVRHGVFFSANARSIVRG